MRTLPAFIVCGALAASLSGFLFTLGLFEPLDRLFFGIVIPLGILSAGAILAQWAGAVLLGFGLAWTTIDIHRPALKGVVAALALLETAGLSWMLRLFGIHWPPFTTLTAGGLAYAFGLLSIHISSGRRKRETA